MKKLYIILITMMSASLCTELMHANMPFVNILNLSDQDITVQLVETNKGLQKRGPIKLKKSELKKQIEFSDGHSLNNILITYSKNNYNIADARAFNKIPWYKKDPTNEKNNSDHNEPYTSSLFCKDYQKALSNKAIVIGFKNGSLTTGLINLSDAEKNPTYEQVFDENNQTKYKNQISNDRDFGMLAMMLNFK